MSKEKQIEEMALDICKSRLVAEDGDACRKCRQHNNCLYQEIAYGLYNAGYRKQSEVDKLKATIERLEQEKEKMLVSATIDIPITMETLFKVRTEHPIFTAIKAEFAREIFEEIDRLLRMGVVEHSDCLDAYVKKGYAELKKKYTGEQT
jgi:hypothetical protein